MTSWIIDKRGLSTPQKMAEAKYSETNPTLIKCDPLCYNENPQSAYQ